MARLDLGQALRAARLADPAAIPDVIFKIAGALGASDVVVYLVDFAQTTLEPLVDRNTHAVLPASELVAATMAGRAFVDARAVVAERVDGVRVWVPVVEGSDRTGVLALTVPDGSDEVVAACEELGLFTGYLLATQARATDQYNLRRRRRSLSLAASMQWDLLPPLVLKTERVSVAGLVEPAYEVGGDCFDYALNGSVLDIGIFDPVGHGIASALIAALCVGSYRHCRREGRSLEHMNQQLDAVVTEQFPDLFATGQLARIDLDSGEMTWTNAGHPLPLLLRGGSVIGELACEPSVPWGLGDMSPADAHASPVAVALEPGDGLLFYTDGVIEAHMPGGEQFGLERLIDRANQHASSVLEPEEVVRRLVRSLLDHQDDRLGDDATMVLVQWSGTP